MHQVGLAEARRRRKYRAGCARAAAGPARRCCGRRHRRTRWACRPRSWRRCSAPPGPGSPPRRRGRSPDPAAASPTLVVLRRGHRRHGDDVVRPARRRRRHEVDLDAPHLGMHRLPVGQHPVAVVAGDPVAHEARRGIEAELAGLQLAELNFAEPGLEGLVADFLAQPVADAHPVRFQLLPARNFFHLGPRHCLLFVRCVLIVARYRRLNSVQVCLHGSPAAFHPPAVPRLACASRGPSKPSATLKTCTVAGRGHGFRRRGRSSSTPTEKQQRRLLVARARPRARPRIPDWAACWGRPATRATPASWPASRGRAGRHRSIQRECARRSGPRPCVAQDLPGRRRRHVAGIAGGGGHLVRTGDLVVFRHGPRFSFAGSRALNDEPTIDGGHTAQ